MKDKELEDIAWRLIAEAKAEGSPNRRRRLMQEAFELVRCASALRESLSLGCDLAFGVKQFEQEMASDGDALMKH